MVTAPAARQAFSLRRVGWVLLAVFAVGWIVEGVLRSNETRLFLGLGLGSVLAFASFLRLGPRR